jgi:medium-chain acyl-[acyl-carrier-protein] hydrolase
MKDYEKITRIDFKETDRFLYVKLDAFVQMLNTTSMYHTVSLGLSPNYMEKLGLVWVLYSWKLHLEDGDHYAKNLSFKTFALFQKDIYSHRYFYVLDEEGKTVGYALSVWIIIDAKKRKLVKIPEHVKDAFLDKIDPTLSPLQNRIVQGIDAKPLKKRRNAPYTHEKQFEIRFHDIDSNDHVNNTIYINWAMESLTSDQNEQFLLDNVPENLSIVYKKEKRPGGNVVVRSILEEMESYHEIYDEEDNLLSLVELKWKRRM